MSVQPQRSSFPNYGAHYSQAPIPTAYPPQFIVAYPAPAQALVPAVYQAPSLDGKTFQVFRYNDGTEYVLIPETGCLVPISYKAGTVAQIVFATQTPPARAMAQSDAKSAKAGATPAAASPSEQGQKLMSYEEVHAIYGAFHAPKKEVPEAEQKLLSQAAHYHLQCDAKEIDCLKMLPDNPQYQEFLALGLYSKGRYVEAFQTMSRAYEKDPSLLPAFLKVKLNYGYLFHRGTIITEVFDEYFKGTQKRENRGNWNAFVNECADIHYNLFDLDDAYALYFSLWKDDKTNFIPLFNMAIIRFEQANYSDSIALFLRLRQAVPGFKTAEIFLALMRAKGLEIIDPTPISEQASMEIPPGLTGFERYPFNLLLLAEQLYVRGQYNEALIALRRMPADPLMQMHATLLLEARIAFRTSGVKKASIYFAYLVRRRGNEEAALIYLANALKHEGVNVRDIHAVMIGIDPDRASEPIKNAEANAGAAPLRIPICIHKSRPSTFTPGSRRPWS